MDVNSVISNLSNDYSSKVSDILNQAASSISTEVSPVSDKSGTFDAIYDSVSGLVGSTNSYIQQAQQAEIDFALGNMTNTHELGVYQQKANIALQYTVAIRDKALEAYREIMNMSI